MKFLLKIGLCLLSLSIAEAKLKIGGIEVTDTNEHYLTYARHMTVPFASQNGAVWDAGNNVQGNTASEIQAIAAAIKVLETDERQKEIHDRMVATPNEWFNFTDVAHAKATVIQRLETIRMMTIFNSIDSPYKLSGLSETTAALWEKGPPGAAFQFRQKGGTAYNAITQLCDGSSVTKGDCLGAKIACVWWGASQGMESAKFNQLYPGMRALNMNYHPTTSTSSYNNSQDAIDASENHHIPGDCMYMRNHNYSKVITDIYFSKIKKWIDPEKTYFLSGENVVYYGIGIYQGLGLDQLSTAGLRDVLMNAYNDDLANVIANQGTINGVEVKRIRPGLDAESKIVWIAVERVKH